MELPLILGSTGPESALLRRRALVTSGTLSCAAAVQETFEARNTKVWLHRDYDLNDSAWNSGFWKMQSAVRRSDGKAVVIKMPFWIESDTSEKLRREHDILKRIHHPYIVQAIELVFDGLDVGLVTERISGCFLSELVVNAPMHRLSEGLARSLSIKLFQGIEYLHSQDICHRGISQRKVLVSDDHKILKLTDFTGACKFDIPVPVAAGADAVSMPNDRSEKMSAQASDVLDGGACLHFMLSGQTLCTSSSCGACQLQHLNLSDDAWCPVSSAALEVMSWSLTLDSKRRPSVSELLQFQWLQPQGIEKEGCLAQEDVQVITNAKATVMPQPTKLIGA